MKHRTFLHHAVATMLAFFAVAFIAPAPGMAQDLLASRRWEVKEKNDGFYQPGEVVFFIPGPGILQISEEVQPYCRCGHTWLYFNAEYRKRGSSVWEKGWPREVALTNQTCNEMVEGKPYRCDSTLKVSPGGENYQIRILMTPNYYGRSTTTLAQVFSVSVKYISQGTITTTAPPKGTPATGGGTAPTLPTPTNPKDTGTGKSGKEPADTAQMTIQAGSRIAKVGDTVTIPIWLIHGQGVANLNMNLGYDAAVVKTTGTFAKGNLVPQALFEANTGESGIVRIGFAQNKDIVGPETGTLAQITFTALGRPGDVTPLRVDVTTLASAAGVKPNVATIHGEIRIVGSSGVIDGDSDRDGRLTARDAQNALKMSVRLMPVDMVCDMDRDGQVTSTDARLILQKVVGK
jgi:hypothetical protein